MKKVKYEQVELHRRICEVYKKHRVQYPKRPKKNIEWFHIYAKLQQLNGQPVANYPDYDSWVLKEISEIQYGCYPANCGGSNLSIMEFSWGSYPEWINEVFRY